MSNWAHFGSVEEERVRIPSHLQVVFSEVNISFWVYVCFPGKSRYRILMQEDTLVHLIRKFLSYILAYFQIQTYFRYVWKNSYLISWHFSIAKRTSCTFGQILSLGSFPFPNVHYIKYGVRSGESYLLAFSKSKRSSCAFGRVLSLGIFPCPNVHHVRLDKSYLLAYFHV